MRKTRSQGPRLGAEERRERILAAAVPCFARRGYAAAGTRDLARAAGVSEPILYRHFEDKAGLFRAVLQRVGERLTQAVEGALAGADDADARLRALGQMLPGLLEAQRDELRVLNAAAGAHEEPEILEAAAACARNLGLVLARAFRGAGLRAGVRAETAGFLLLEVGMGAALLDPLALPELEEGRFRDRAVQLLLRGIAR